MYWNGDNRRVLRGHWFALKGGLDWLPIPETVAEQLEVSYRNKVSYLSVQYVFILWPRNSGCFFLFVENS